MKINKLFLVNLFVLFALFAISMIQLLQHKDFTTVSVLANIGSNAIPFFINLSLIVFVLILIDVESNINVVFSTINVGLSVVVFDLVKRLHFFIRANDFKFNFFLNSFKSQEISTIQYTQIYILCIGFLFGLAAYFYFNFHWKKFFIIVFTVSFYVFMFVIHYFLIEGLRNTAMVDYREQIELVADNKEDYKQLCINLNFACVLVNSESVNNEYRVLILPDGQAGSIEVNSLITTNLLKFKESGLERSYILLNKFEMIGVLSFAFEFIRSGNDILIIVNQSGFKNIVYYSIIYFFVPFLLFCGIWSAGIYSIYKRHKQFPPPSILVNYEKNKAN